MRTKCSAAAAVAELEQQRSRERKKTTKKARMKKDLKVVPIYEEKTDRAGARNEEADTWLSSHSDASIFGMVIKDKDPLGYD